MEGTPDRSGPLRAWTWLCHLLPRGDVVSLSLSFPSCEMGLLIAASLDRESGCRTPTAPFITRLTSGKVSTSRCSFSAAGGEPPVDGSQCSWRGRLRASAQVNSSCPPRPCLRQVFMGRRVRGGCAVLCRGDATAFLPPCCTVPMTATSQLSGAPGAPRALTSRARPPPSHLAVAPRPAQVRDAPGPGQQGSDSNAVSKPASARLPEAGLPREGPRGSCAATSPPGASTPQEGEAAWTETVLTSAGSFDPLRTQWPRPLREVLNRNRDVSLVSLHQLDRASVGVGGWGQAAPFH